MMNAREWLGAGAIAAVVATVLPLTQAAAQGRPDTRALSCAEAQALVQQRGPIVLSTGEFTYDRFVSNGLTCGRLRRTRPKYVPTADDPQCRLEVCGSVLRSNDGRR